MHQEELDLSILICTLPQRKVFLDELLNELNSQVEGKPVEILVEEDNGEHSTGWKRQRLLERSKGRYVCFVDDDDRTSKRYIELILDALKSSPDCVGITGVFYMDGAYDGLFRHDLAFKSWDTPRAGKFKYIRPPNHLNPIKRELALKAGFPDKTLEEDREFSMAVLPYLKTQEMVEIPVYMYLCSSIKLS